jgi:hypothetical protein
MVGYMPQYELGAVVILRHLRDQSFEFVRLSDATAGRVDDFVIGSSGAIDGYSVKWSQYRATITLNDVVKQRKSGPWIKQLADGWEALKAHHVGRKPTVHLVSSDVPSTSDSCAGATGNLKTFAAFMHQAWLPRQEIGQPVPADWAGTWEHLRMSSGLDADRFEEFVKDCRLDLDTTLPTNLATSSRDDTAYVRQIRELARVLPDIVRDPSRRVEYDRASLLQRVGWTELFELRHRHEFPVRDPYEPIGESVNALRTKLKNLPGGYIGFFGSPGSGKSTLLTRTLEGGLSEHRLIKYYAFVPGSADPRSKRGESVNFLHDLVLSLERAGLSIGRSQGVFDQHLLQERLQESLQLLGRNFASTKFPTVILVDGLDHIPREQSPERSLVVDLPTPDQIPEGVYFVLGSQTDDLPGLPPSVRRAVQDPSRRIDIQPLSRTGSLNLIAGAGLNAPLKDVHREKIVVLANGHPLALALLLNRLAVCATGADVDQVLDDALPYQGSIDSYYYAHWEQIAADPALAELVGQLARLRRSIDLDWVATWAGVPAVTLLQKKLRHFFREERPGHWQFFHNSFRQYVLSSSSGMTGLTQEAAESHFHGKLATACLQSGVPHAWETVFHLASARDVHRVLEFAMPAYFRAQLEEMRPIDQTLRDARYAVQAAGAKRDIVSLVRMTLFLAELSQRSHAVESWTVGKLLLSLGKLALAMEYIWDGAELQLSDRAAMETAARLFRGGRQPEARRLFEMAEPLALFQAPVESDRAYADIDEDLTEWAKTAPLFRPIEEVIGIIRRFVPPRSRFNNSEKSPSPEPWRRRLLFHAALSAWRADETAEAEAVQHALQASEVDEHEESRWLLVHKFRDLQHEGKAIEAREVLRSLLDAPDAATYDDDLNLILAEGVIRLLDDVERAQGLLNKLPIPTIVFQSLSNRSLNDHIGFFRFYRLLACFGRCPSAIDVAPNPTQAEGWPEVLLGRTLVQIARLWGDAWSGTFHADFELRQYLHQPLRLFQRNWRETRSWHSWFIVESFRSELHDLLVQAVTQHGAAAVETLKEEVAALWQDQQSSWAWSANARRGFVVALYEAGIDPEWAARQLSAIENTMLDGCDVSGRIEECEAQAEAWLALGHREEAASELKRLVRTSFGVAYRKDYQMGSWIEWLTAVLPLEPQLAPERLVFFAAAIAVTEATTEGRGTRSAAIGLIESCATISPVLAVRIATFFEEHGCLDHSGAVDAILRVALDRHLCRPSVVEAVFTNFLAAFSDDSHAALAGDLLRALGEEKQRQDLTDACSRMVNGVRIHMVPNSRPAALREIKSAAVELGLDLGECNLMSIPEPSGGDAAYESSPTPVSESATSKGEAEAEACTLKAFLRMIADTPNAQSKLRRVLDKLLPTLSLADTRSLAIAIRDSIDDSVSLAKVSLRLSDQGDRHLAWEIGKIALSKSQAYGWIAHGDSGSRLWAARALVAADPEPGRSIALSQFAEDLSAGLAFPTEVAQDLFELTPLFVGRMPIVEIYPLIEEHVRQLAAPMPLLHEAKLTLSPLADEDTVEQAICDVMAHHLDEFVPLLAQAAGSVLRRLLELGSAAATRTIRRLLAGSDHQKTATVELLEVLAVTRLDLLQPYGDQLRVLARADNYWVNLTARKFCASLQLEGLAEPTRRPLPAIYTLSLSPTSKSDGPVAVDEPLGGSDGSRDLVRPYDLNLCHLSKLAGLEDESVIARAASLMRQSAPADSLTPDAERHYRERLRRAGLELSYRRLRGAYAREAMQHVAGELVAAGRIDAADLPTFERIIRFSDPKLATSSPSERPTELAPLSGLKPFRTDAKEWVAQPPYACPEHLRALGNMQVIGEFTELRLLGHLSLRETRVSIVGEENSTEKGSLRVFGEVAEILLAEYPTFAMPRRAAPFIILKNQTYGFDTEGTGWLSLNPLAAKSLGWLPAKEGLFRWLDTHGDLMAETVWWKDGRLGQYGGEGEVGEGWIVVASEAGFKAILNLFGHPVRACGVERSHGEGDERVNGPSVWHEEPVP